MPARGRAKEVLGLAVVSRWSWRTFDGSLNDGIIVGWEEMAALVAVDRWLEATNVDGFHDTAVVPIGVSR